MDESLTRFQLACSVQAVMHLGEETRTSQSVLYACLQLSKRRAIVTMI